MFYKNKIQLIKSGKQYFDLLLSLINHAKESIHLQTYIYNDDETGNLIMDALKIASNRKVKIYILVDGYGSKNLSKTFINKLKIEKINFRFFEPLFKNDYFYFGRRIHHKMIVVDTRFAVVGGMNIANKYNDMPELPAWIDYAIYAEGTIAKELCILCWKTWNGFTVNMGITPCDEKTISFCFNDNETSLIRMRRNDWVRRKNEISTTYKEIFKNADKQITIMCSYFLPGSKVRKLLRCAVEKNVSVRLILAGQSDVKIAKSAERWMYDWLLRNNIEIYEYQPTVLHAKICVVDEIFVTIGSYNLNNISAYASIELNIDVKDALFAKEVTTTLNTILKNDCIQITDEKYKQTNNIFKQLYNWGCHKIFRIGFFLFTFYFKQQE